MGVKKTNIKCLGCGGELKFSPQNQALICANCGRIHKFETKHNVLKFDYNNENLKQSNQSKVAKSTNCSNCGASLNVLEKEITKTCPYCSSNFVLDKSEIIGLKPNNIIPFTFSKEKAIEYYKKNVKHKWFLPNKFKKNPNVDNVTGTYISCFSFDSDTFSKYNGALSIDHTHYRDGKSYTTTETKYIKGTKSLNFEDFLVESSSLTNQGSFEEIKPYVVSSDTCFEYDENFLRGYSVESYDNDIENCKKISEELMKVQIKNNILSGYHYSRVQYFNLTTTFDNNKYSYILLPIYFINFNYKNKTYRTYLNGQTGKIGNDLPKSKVKIAFAVLLGILFVIGMILLAMFLPEG